MLANDDRALKPGMLMRVELHKNPRDALVIPEEALVPGGGKQFVYLVDEAGGNRVVRREVQIGGRRAGEVEILDGLAGGDKVITDGTLKVSPGRVVSIRALDDGRRALREMLESAQPAERTP